MTAYIYLEYIMDQQRLKHFLEYDPETGIWTWKVNNGPVRAGDRAGTLRSNGYRQIRIASKFYFEHRLAFLYMIGRWPDPEGEHRNRKPSDNRWTNLREATRTQNQQNHGETKSKTGYRGVYLETRTGRFYAQIKVNKKIIGLGTFDTPEEANEVRVKATVLHHGEFAYSFPAD